MSSSSHRLVLLLEMRVIQPWVDDVRDLGRLGLVDRNAHACVHMSDFWCAEMSRMLGVLVTSEVLLTGEDLVSSYRGAKNSWEFFHRERLSMGLARLDFSRKRTAKMWKRVLAYFGLLSDVRATPNPCFYLAEENVLHRVTDCYYFEVTLVHVPPMIGTPSPSLGVGLCTDADVLLGNEWFVGWTRQSVGWYTDDRTIWCNNRALRRFCGPCFCAGDVMGCGWQRYLGVWMAFFTENGRLVFRRPTHLAVDAVMAVVVHDREAGFRFTTNFGAAPFRYTLKN